MPRKGNGSSQKSDSRGVATDRLDRRGQGRHGQVSQQHGDLDQATAAIWADDLAAIERARSQRGSDRVDEMGAQLVRIEFVDLATRVEVPHWHTLPIPSFHVVPTLQPGASTSNSGLRLVLHASTPGALTGSLQAAQLTGPSFSS